MQAALERVVGEIVLGASPPSGDARALEAYVERFGLDAANAASLRQNLERLLVYRTLVRTRLREAIELAIPRTLARLGTLFDEYFDRFLAERGPRTHYLRDVTSEWLDHAAPLWRADPRIPPYLHDLARHEALEIVVASGADVAPGTPTGELALDRRLSFIEAACVVRYAFAVHTLPEELADRSEPPSRATALFVYRSPEHDVRYLELTPLAAAILEQLLAGAALGEAVTFAARTAAVPLTPAVLEGTASLLADLADRGALLGASKEEPLKPAREDSTMALSRGEKDGP
ncbi:MAG TPA: DUF2063 domain-containing protein [Polyangiaceae bacterium]